MTENIFILVYIISIIGMYWYIRLAHYHERGIYKDLYPSTIDYIIMLSPFFNTVMLIIYFIVLFPVVNNTIKKSKNPHDNIFNPNRNKL